MKRKSEKTAICCCKWTNFIGPMETVVIAENAPRLLMVLQNLGPAPVVLTSGDRHEFELLHDEMRVVEAYGLIAIRNKEQVAATVAMEFTPRAK